MAINTIITGSYSWNGNSHTNCFVYKGIRYTNCLYENCFYIKYKLPNNVTLNNIIKGIEYYIYQLSFNNNNTVNISLSLSHKEHYITENEKQIYTINLDTFFNGLCMPGAIIKYHANGYPFAEVDEFGCSFLTTEITSPTTLPYKTTDLFYDEDDANSTELSWYYINGTNDVIRFEVSTNSWYYDYSVPDDPSLHYSSALNWDSHAIDFPNTTFLLKKRFWSIRNQFIRVNYKLNEDHIISSLSSIYSSDNGYYIYLMGPTKEEFFNEKSPTPEFENAMRNQEIIQWKLSDTYNSGYQSNSRFYLSEIKKDLEFTAITKSIQSSSSQFKIWFDNNGGKDGPHLYTSTSSSFTFSPSQELIDEGIGFDDLKNYYPSMPGYEFIGWKSKTDSTIKYPGNTLKEKEIKNHPNWVAQWGGPSGTLTLNTGEMITIGRDDILFSGHTKVYRLGSYPQSRDTYCKFKIHDILALTMRRQMLIRIIDALGNVVPGSTHSFNRGGNIKDGYQFGITLPANKVYYIEIMVESISTTLNPYEIEIIFISKGDRDQLSNSLMIDYNGGIYNNTSYQTKSFYPTLQNEISISTLNNSQTLDGVTPPPTKDNYYFYDWQTTQENVRIYQTNIYTNNNPIQGYEASPLPSKDFTIKANWEPNVFFIKYDGNDNDTTTAMSSSSHKCDQDIHILNQYARSTNLTFIPRKGNYVADQEWLNVSNVEPIINTDNKNRKAKVHHTFNKWLNDKFEIKSPDTIIDFDTFKDLNDVTSFNYGDTIDLTAQWSFNSISLPHMERDGFIFMGWYDAPEGGNKIGDGGDEVIYEDHEITLYAHWDPIGLVMINTPQGWKKAVPYIYTDGTWKRALTNIYTNSNWQLGTNLGQNATDEQLEFL